MISIIFLFLHLAFALLVFFLTLAFLTGAPFVPSTRSTAKIMIRLAHISPGKKVYDLGAGDGRLLFLAQQEGAIATGFEINPFLVMFTWLKILVKGKQKWIAIYWKNFWDAHLKDADIVFVYLLPWKMDALERMLTAQLHPGAIIVSNSFIFSNFVLIKKDEKAHVYVFKV